MLEFEDWPKLTFGLSKVEILINIVAVLTIPLNMFSFWRFSQRKEYAALRESGQKLNLNMRNLRSGFQRKPNDPLRESHIKLAKIGFLHWFAIPLCFLAIGLVGILLVGLGLL